MIKWDARMAQQTEVNEGDTSHQQSEWQSHMIISLDPEEIFDKSQLAFIIK
jgi:hypothetical protein